MSSKLKTRLFLTSLCLGFFIVILDITIVNVSLPSIYLYFHTSLVGTQWIVAGYSITFASFLLMAGALSDKYNSKYVYMIGIIAFSLTSFACALSQSIYQLVFFRMAQGIAGAILIPSSLALINISYEDEKSKAKAIGIWTSIGGVACALGPVIGGILTGIISWRSIFLINLIVGFFAYIFIAKFPVPYQKKTVNFDILGQILGMLFIILVSFSLINSSYYDWDSFFIITSMLLGIVCLILFIYTEYFQKNQCYHCLFFAVNSH